MRFFLPGTNQPEAGQMGPEIEFAINEFTPTEMKVTIRAASGNKVICEPFEITEMKLFLTAVQTAL